jgi:hydroxylaminobenzene mutase
MLAVYIDSHGGISRKGRLMDPDSALVRQGRLLLQVGVSMFLFTSFWGFVIRQAASPRIAVSAHTLSALQAVMLLTQGLIWPKLKPSVVVSWVAFWFSLHATFAILSAYVVAALVGIGNQTIVLAGELPHGLARHASPREPHQASGLFVGANWHHHLCAYAVGTERVLARVACPTRGRIGWWSTGEREAWCWTGGREHHASKPMPRS